MAKALIPLLHIEDVCSNYVHFKLAHASPAHAHNFTTPHNEPPHGAASKLTSHRCIELGARASAGTEPASHTTAGGAELEGEASGVRWESASGRGARNMARDTVGRGDALDECYRQGDCGGGAPVMMPMPTKL